MYTSNMYTHTFITFLASIGSTCICNYHYYYLGLRAFVKIAKQHSITRAIIDRMSATASRNSKKAFDNLKWGFNLGPMWPSIGLD